MLTLPYVGRDTVRLGKRLKSCFNRLFSVELKIVYKNTKVGDYFTLKDRTPSLFASNVVYRFRCSVDGDTSYIGVTTRQLFERIAEHRDPKRLSAVQSHLAICEDCCNVPNFSRLFSVMKRCRTQREARAMEVMLISEYHPSLNIQLGECRGQSFLLKVYRWSGWCSVLAVVYSSSVENNFFSRVAIIIINFVIIAFLKVKSFLMRV